MRAPDRERGEKGMAGALGGFLGMLCHGLRVASRRGPLNKGSNRVSIGLETMGNGLV